MKWVHLEHDLFSPLKSESFFHGFVSPCDKREIKPAPPYREKLRDGGGTCDAARVPIEVTRLGSFSSFVTGGSDPVGAVKEQWEQEWP